ncbi:MAG: (Fe-S)-binding protein [Rhodocyclaceae bacterium]|nr:(Fe-S)-binding protein [Rhodocyclaceae bacterium]
MRVGLLVTCLVDLMRPRIGFAALELLEAAGCTVIVPEQQTCCGQPAWNNGDRANAARLAKKLITEFEGCEYLVAPSGSCADHVRHGYPRILADEPTWQARAQALAAKTHELADFLVRIACLQKMPGNFAGRITYHDSCSGLRGLGVKEQPRALLQKLPALELVEMRGAEECCGFGGTFSVKFGAVSAAIAERKCHQAQALGVDAIVGGDLGCLLNIEGKLRRMGDAQTKVMHFAEVLTAKD